MEEREARLPEGVIDARKWRRWLGQQRPISTCLCSCGEPVRKGRLFCLGGHASRMVELAKRYVRGEVQPDEEQMKYLKASGKLDAAVERVKIEDSSRRGRRPSGGMRTERAEPRALPRVF